MSLLSPLSVVQYDDLNVVIEDAEEELNVMVEGTYEGFARGRALSARL
jgi:hypothetical protein